VTAESASSSGPRESPGRVLLIENDLFFSARILSVLEKAGYVARTAASREAGEREIVDSPPDAVILNLASPALGGVGFIRRAKELSPRTKVITYLSHVKIPDIRAEVMAAGADKLCANSAITMRLPAILRDTLAGIGATVED
jgi:DNA-binding NarL/FixJ family response regulator